MIFRKSPEEIDRGELSVVLNFELPEKVAEQRLLGRMRDDDTPEVIAERLTTYHRETEPLVEHYRTSGNVVGIHADRSINEVFSEIQEALEQVAVR